MGCHILFQGILLTQELNLSLLHLMSWQADSLALHHLGSPIQGTEGKKTWAHPPGPLALEETG